MNIRTFNESFKDMLDVMAKVSPTPKSSKYIQDVLVSPLIVHSLSDQTLSDTIAGEETEPIYLPFSIFRACVRLSSTGDLVHMAVINKDIGKEVEGLAILFEWMQPDGKRARGVITYVEKKIQLTGFKNGKWIIVDDRAGEYICTIMASLARETMSSTNRLVEVRPNRPDCSVEWVKARTHYTLITHDHPANNACVTTGQRVAAPVLTRMAHSRRAHFKTLRHPRYRFARGQTIFVRQAWVGPKEWQDAGGKQIYRILEEQPK